MQEENHIQPSAPAEPEAASNDEEQAQQEQPQSAGFGLFDNIANAFILWMLFHLAQQC